MGMKKEMKKINPKAKSQLSSSVVQLQEEGSLPIYSPVVYKDERRGNCVLYFLRGNVLRRIINVLVMHCCVYVKATSPD